MPRFEPKTFRTFLERMSYRVVARTALTDLEPGGNLHTLLAAVARELDDISFQSVNLQTIWDIDTASGEDLDARALDFPPDGLVRQGEVKASTGVVFSRTGTVGAVAIPPGSVVRVPSGPEFATSTSGGIANGFSASGTIGVVALVAGVGGNVDPNAITQLDAITGIETVTNAAAATGGQDQETDAEFRARIKLFLRSLPRGTPDALKFAVLDTFLEDFGRIVTAEVIELEGADLGQVIIFVDDGAGTIEVTQNNLGSPEVVVGTAIGGEERLFLDNKPIKAGTTFILRINLVAQVEDVDFTLHRATGQITLTVALTAGDAVEAEYTWFIGLIAEAQKIIDGDPLDRINFPGFRAAGVQVFVLAPIILQQIIQGTLIVEDQFLGQAAEVRASASAAINRYINGLGINGDVILSELTAAGQSIPGVRDILFTIPTSNVVIGSGELARVVDSNIDLG